MKREFVFALALLALAGCGEAEKADVPKDGFSVGDICTKKDRQCIVVRVNLDRKSGLLMSLEETQCGWNEANLWVASFGSDWRLPTKLELEAIYNIKDRVDAVFSEYGIPILGHKDYWSSDEAGYADAWYVDMGDGYAKCGGLNLHAYVRAVSEF